MSAADLAIIDSGGANLASLQYALQRLGQDSVVTSDRKLIRDASHVILPGVGAARNAMQTIANYDLVDEIRALTQPVLGICLGMQLLCERSEEDDVECLGVIPGTAKKLPASVEMPVPNMGWSPIHVVQPHPVLSGIGDDAWFYFVHSYALTVDEPTVASSKHVDDFAAVIGKDNFVATQFHPERSARSGAQVLANFLEWQV
jgi:glutamine amidotransferase